MMPRKPADTTKNPPAIAAKAGELSTEIVKYDPALADQVRKDYKTGLKKLRSGNVMSSVFYTAAAGAGGLVVSVSAALGDPMLLVICGPQLACMLAITGLMGKETTQKAQAEARNAQGRLRKEFLKAQRKSFSANQVKLVELAEAHLGAGGLLDEESLAYLAAIEPKHLQEASQQLAISVFQARKMLSYLHNPGGVEKPLTFAALDLTPKSEKHRFVLLEKLRAQDDGQRQEYLPALQHLDMKDANFKPGIGGKALRYLFTPYAVWRESRRYKKFTLPDLPDTPVPALRPAENFSVKLHKYETEIERLDLPALRGWPKTLKALPKPPV
jgi:hypothetical protein